MNSGQNYVASIGKSAAQYELCVTKRVPHLVPDSGICKVCKNDVYQGYTYYTCATEQLTRCPFCNVPFQKEGGR